MGMGAIATNSLFTRNMLALLWLTVVAALVVALSAAPVLRGPTAATIADGASILIAPLVDWDATRGTAPLTAVITASPSGSSVAEVVGPSVGRVEGNEQYLNETLFFLNQYRYHETSHFQMLGPPDVQANLQASEYRAWEARLGWQDGSSIHIGALFEHPSLVDEVDVIWSRGSPMTTHVYLHDASSNDYTPGSTAWTLVYGPVSPTWVGCNGNSGTTSVTGLAATQIQLSDAVAIKFDASNTCYESLDAIRIKGQGYFPMIRYRADMSVSSDSFSFKVNDGTSDSSAVTVSVDHATGSYTSISGHTLRLTDAFDGSTHQTTECAIPVVPMIPSQALLKATVTVPPSTGTVELVDWVGVENPLGYQWASEIGDATDDPGSSMGSAADTDIGGDGWHYAVSALGWPNMNAPYHVDSETDTTSLVTNWISSFAFANAQSNVNSEIPGVFVAKFKHKALPVGWEVWWLERADGITDVYYHDGSNSDYTSGSTAWTGVLTGRTPTSGYPFSTTPYVSSGTITGVTVPTDGLKIVFNFPVGTKRGSMLAVKLIGTRYHPIAYFKPNPAAAVSSTVTDSFSISVTDGKETVSAASYSVSFTVPPVPDEPTLLVGNSATLDTTAGAVDLDLVLDGGNAKRTLVATSSPTYGTFTSAGAMSPKNPAPATQWASSVWASSSTYVSSKFQGDFEGEQALGPPYWGYGKVPGLNPQAWRPLISTSDETLTVGFDTAVVATRIEIIINFHANTITKVEIHDASVAQGTGWTTVATRSSTADAFDMRVVVYAVDIDPTAHAFLTDGVRITMAKNGDDFMSTIDAIKLFGNRYPVLGTYKPFGFLTSKSESFGLAVEDMCGRQSTGLTATYTLSAVTGASVVPDPTTYKIGVSGTGHYTVTLSGSAVTGDFSLAIEARPSSSGAASVSPTTVSMSAETTIDVQITGSTIGLIYLVLTKTGGNPSTYATNLPDVTKFEFEVVAAVAVETAITTANTPPIYVGQPFAVDIDTATSITSALTLALVSDNTGIATLSTGSVTFTGPAAGSITVTPVGVGQIDISSSATAGIDRGLIAPQTLTLGEAFQVGWTGPIPAALTIDETTAEIGTFTLVLTAEPTSAVTIAVDTVAGQWTGNSVVFGTGA